MSGIARHLYEEESLLSVELTADWPTGLRSSFQGWDSRVRCHAQFYVGCGDANLGSYAGAGSPNPFYSIHGLTSDIPPPLHLSNL